MNLLSEINKILVYGKFKMYNRGFKLVGSFFFFFSNEIVL